MDPNIPLDVKIVDGATAVKFVANQSPVILVLADVADGTMQIDLSTDDFASDIRRVAFLDPPAAGPSVQHVLHKQVLKNERVRVTTTASAKSHLRTTIPGLAQLP
jgi:hypothetical protein